MKRFNRLVLALSVVILCLIVGNMLMLLDMKTAIETGRSMQEWMGTAVAVIIAAAALFHLLGLFNLFVHLKVVQNESMMWAAAFVTGIFSLFLLAIDVVMLRDIGNEYSVGHEISGEWGMVFAGHVIHILFFTLILIQCVSANKRTVTKAIPVVKDESIFLTVHQIGVISAACGFISLFLLCSSGISIQYQNRLLFISCIVILIPYAIAAAYWFFTKRKQKPADWYDEKQFMDICRGALITLLITTLATIVFYFMASCGQTAFEATTWFPTAIFLTLLLFSCSTLYLSKRG